MVEGTYFAYFYSSSNRPGMHQVLSEMLIAGFQGYFDLSKSLVLLPRALRGGFQLRPRLVEFWEGQPSRLHDRIVYSRSSPDGEGPDAGDEWTISRLQP